MKEVSNEQELIEQTHFTEDNIGKKEKTNSGSLQHLEDEEKGKNGERKTKIMSKIGKKRCSIRALS